MKMYCNRLVREEKGKVLIMVLILLVVGGLVLTPLLGLMQTGLIAGQLYERKTAELYAADAGVEEAIWGIQNDNLVWSGNHYELETISLNDKDVDVEIYRKELDGSTPCHPSYMYQIISIATSGDRGATKIEAWLDELKELADFSGLWDNLITINEDLSDGEIDRLEKDLVHENLTLEFKDECYEECEDECFVETDCVPVWDYDKVPEGCEGCGAVYNYPDELWPDAELLAQWYRARVAGEPSYGHSTIDLAGVDEDVGPLYRDGVLNIYNSGSNNATLTLGGTLYITGDTEIGTQRKDFTLDLNGQTIFVKSGTTHNKAALEIGDRVTILGPGAIIAVGDIKFAPKGEVGSNEEPVFILSIAGTTDLFPSGEFYGAVAGNVYVDVDGGRGPTLTYPPGGFGDQFDFFPSLVEVDRTYDIRSWTIGPKAE